MEYPNMDKRWLILVGGLAVTMTSGAYAAWSKTWNCTGTRHKGSDPPSAFKADVTGPSGSSDAEKAAREGEAAHGWTVDSVSCSDSVDAAAMWVCRGKVTCETVEKKGTPVRTGGCDYDRRPITVKAGGHSNAANLVIEACKDAFKAKYPDAIGWSCQGQGVNCSAANSPN